MNDERRAEIEAVARALYQRGLGQEVGWDSAQGTLREDAAAIVAALDRLRDARGDDEAGTVSHWECECGQRVEWKFGAWFCPMHRDLAVVHPVATRSPQGEDHEQKWQLWLNAAERDAVLAMRRRRVSAPKADENQEAR